MFNTRSAFFKLISVLTCASVAISALGAGFALNPITQERQDGAGSGIVERPNPGEFYRPLPKKQRKVVIKPSYDVSFRGNLWTETSKQAFETIRTTIEPEGLWLMDSVFMNALPPSNAAPGSGFSWEGAIGDVNTATGNKLTTVDIIDWPSRGDLRVDLSFHHSSLYSTVIQHHMTNGWSLSYDIRVAEEQVNGSDFGFVIWGDGTVFPYGAKNTNTGVFARPTGIFDDLKKNPDGTYTLTMKNQWKYEFNSTGQCTQIKDRWGHALSISWASYSVGTNTYYQVSSVTDPDGRSISISYNGTSRRLETVTTNFDSRTWNVLYTGDNLTKVEWPLLSGQQNRSYREFGYTSNRITSDRSLRGRISTYEYNSDGSIWKATTPGGFLTEFLYSNGVTTVKLPKPSTIQQPRQIIHTYANGRLEEVTDEAGYVKSYTYNSNNLVTLYEDPFLNSWHTQTYDSNGNATYTVGPGTGYTHTYTYNSTNDLTSVIDGENIKTVYEYYGANEADGPEGALKLIKTRTQTTPDEEYQLRSKFTYFTGSSDKGQLKTIVKETGENPNKILTTTLAYTTKGEVLSVTNPDGSVCQFTSYGNLSNLQTLVEPGAVSTTIGYDNWYRPVTTTQGNATVTTAYLDDGLISSVTLSGSDLPQSNASQVTSYTYDDDNRLTSKTDANNKTETYSYTNSPWLTSVTNTRNYTRNYTYNIRGEVRQLTMPDNTHEKWTYNGIGQVSSYSTGSVVGMTLHEFTINYTYDDWNRLAEVDYDDGIADTIFTYDWADRMTQMDDTSGTTTWEYFNTGLVKKITAPNGNTEYTYNDNDTRATLITGEGTTTYGYDSYGRPSSVQNPAGETTSWLYDSAGRLQKQTFHSGVYETYAYDSRGRTDEIAVRNSSHASLEFQILTYDDAGNMKTRDHSDLVTTYTYDKLNQLLTETRGTGATYFKDTYTYDDNGNRTAKEERRGAGPTITNRSYTYDNSDKMTNYDGTTISYDNFGRPTQWVVDRPSPNGRGLVNLSFDYESRLKTMAIPGGSVYQTNTYNGLNTRVKVVETGYGSGTRKYVRDGVGVTSPVLRMTTGAENTPTWTNFVPGVSERTSGTTKYAHSGIKNVDAQSSSNQTISATREYDAFGNVADSSGAFTGRFGYGGGFGYQVDDGGLKLLGHRFYDPVCGRFLTRDRVKDGGNWFAYCGNNPISRADPVGFAWIVLCVDRRGIGHVWVMVIWDNGEVWIMENTMFGNNELTKSGVAPDEIFGTPSKEGKDNRADYEYWVEFDESKFTRQDMRSAFNARPNEYHLLTNSCQTFATMLFLDVTGVGFYGATPTAIGLAIGRQNRRGRGNRPSKFGGRPKIGDLDMLKKRTQKIGGGGVKK